MNEFVFSVALVAIVVTVLTVILKSKPKEGSSCCSKDSSCGANAQMLKEEVKETTSKEKEDAEENTASPTSQYEFRNVSIYIDGSLVNSKFKLEEKKRIWEEKIKETMNPDLTFYEGQNGKGIENSVGPMFEHVINVILLELTNQRSKSASKLLETMKEIPFTDSFLIGGRQMNSDGNNEYIIQAGNPHFMISIWLEEFKWRK